MSKSSTLGTLLLNLLPVYIYITTPTAHQFIIPAIYAKDHVQDIPLSINTGSQSFLANQSQADLGSNNALLSIRIPFQPSGIWSTIAPNFHPIPL